MPQYSNYNSVEISVIEVKTINILMEKYRIFLWKQRVRRFPTSNMVLFLYTVDLCTFFVL